jgi:hypothetical protein
MSGKKGDEPQRGQPQDNVQVLIHPRLRLLVVEAVNIIEIDRKTGVDRMGAGGSGEKVADQYQPGGYRGPGEQGSFVIAEANQKPNKQQGQPAMKERKPAEKKRQPGVEHIARQVQEMESQKVNAEIHEPERLRDQNTHRAHADEQGTFQPHADHGQNEGGVAEPQKIRRPVVEQVNRPEHSQEGCARRLGGQWDFVPRRHERESAHDDFRRPHDDNWRRHDDVFMMFKMLVRLATVIVLVPPAVVDKTTAGGDKGDGAG